MDPEIYRKVALERLSNPERLDALMTVTSPRAWLGLAAACVVIAGALVWGFVGRMPETVHGSGILHRRGGLFEVQAVGSGIVTDLLVKPGDAVLKGQTIARIAQPEIEQNIAQSESRLREFQRIGSTSGSLLRGNRDLELASITGQLRQLDEEQRAARDQLIYLEERLKAQEEAVKRGLINRDLHQATSQDLARTRTSIDGMAAQRTQLQARQASLRNQTDQSLFALDQQIAGERNQLELLRLHYDRSSFVHSPYAGRVVEQLIDEGTTAAPGQSLIAVELVDQQLDGYLFVPLEGKRITAGMAVRLTPSGVSWEEYGYLLGHVASVSEAPLSTTAMNVYLRNPTLVQQFSGGGAAYLVGVDLIEDRSTMSGLKWTSRGGPPLQFGSGTLFDATIVVREEAPITLMLPALRRWMGM